MSPNVWLVTEASINISIVGGDAANRNQMGYFLIDPETQLPINGSYKGEILISFPFFKTK